MTTSVGLRSIDTNQQLLSPLSTPFSIARRIPEPQIHSHTSSPADSESLICFTSQSSAHSFTTSTSSPSEEIPESTKVLKEIRKSINLSTETPSTQGNDMEPTGSSLRTDSRVGVLEIGSEVSRTSHRVRKPTSKAQALLGTRFYRSFMQEEPISGQVERLDTDQCSTTTAENPQEEGDEGQLQLNPIAMEGNVSTSAPSLDTTHEMPNTTVAELTLSPIETNVPRRQSGRDRKPAMRLIESDELVKTQKRELPHNTTDVTPTKRIKLSITPSKLKDCLNILIDSRTPAAPSLNLTKQDTEDKIEAKEPSSIEPSRKDIQPKTCIVTLKLPSDSLKLCDDKKGKLQEDSVSSNHEESLKSMATDQGVSDCDLSCLPPDTIFFLFAEIAADWSDSDEEDGKTTSQEKQGGRLKERVLNYCKCSSNRESR